MSTPVGSCGLVALLEMPVRRSDIMTSIITSHTTNQQEQSARGLLVAPVSPLQEPEADSTQMIQTLYQWISLRKAPLFEKSPPPFSPAAEGGDPLKRGGTL